MFEEAEPEFHTMAFFKTTIRVRNALQDEMVPQVSSDQEALLIHLSRPIMLAQPAAFDKGLSVCVCLSTHPPVSPHNAGPASCL